MQTTFGTQTNNEDNCYIKEIQSYKQEIEDFKNQVKYLEMEASHYREQIMQLTLQNNILDQTKVEDRQIIKYLEAKTFRRKMFCDCAIRAVIELSESSESEDEEQ